MDTFQPGRLPASWVPSDRVAQLQQELTPERTAQLAAMLRRSTYGEWLAWLQAYAGHVAEFDALSARQRSALLQAAPSASGSEQPVPESETHPLRLLHACGFLAHMQHHLQLEMPPRGPRLETAQDQRSLLLQLWNRMPEFEDAALWPFEGPPDHDGPLPYWPFAQG